MLPLPRILLLALALLAFSAQATAAMLPPLAIACAECPEGDGDDGDEHASDFHDHCTCSSHAPRLVSPATTLSAPPQPEDERFLQRAERAPASPDPHRILHVPKA
ncbi:MAG: hypothetical protein ACOX6T_01770 [Myxococcales bacterium]